MVIFIRFFNVSDELIAGEALVSGMGLTAVKQILEVPTDEPMRDSYAVSEEQAKALSGYVELDFDFDRFDYFIECDR